MDGQTKYTYIVDCDSASNREGARPNATTGMELVDTVTEAKTLHDSIQMRSLE